MTAAQRRILVVIAHADDADVHAGGTLARWSAQGDRVHLVVVTNGAKGHDDPTMTRARLIQLRRDEQEAAAATLGLAAVTFLDYEDGDLAWAGPALAEDMTRTVRRERPDLVVSLDPYGGRPRYASYQLHRDHRAVGEAVIDAVYFRAPAPLHYPEQLGQDLRPHRVGEVLLAMGDEHDLFVDITDTFDKKLRAVRAHASQWGAHPDLEGLLRRRASAFGASAGCELAEAFKRLVP